ncbi:MAG: phosphoglycerate kinase [Alphaproteobacteria bacterium CG_4_10_14_0_8_um_filter_37_21]|nr:MAG: phosphoglycerate kinase [Alphaproteobacteria bacterium CG_4_10_14_0_8_um_filter_37_21]
MKKYKTLNEIPAKCGPIFLRLDLNVPIKNGVILDDTRIQKSIQTIKYLKSKTDTLIIATHLGRPTASEDETKWDQKFSTLILQSALEQYLNTAIKHLKTCVNYDAPSPGIYLLENLRFYVGETQDDACFAKNLKGPCAVYVNDAFSCSHREHASVHAIAKLLPSYAGLLLDHELKTLNSFFCPPEKPMMAIIGGSKVSTKVGVLKSLIEKVDYMVIGGAMANTFLKAKGVDVGSSLVENSAMNICTELLSSTHKHKIILPSDFIVAENLQSLSHKHQNSGEQIAGMIFDFGPKSLEMIHKTLELCNTVLWNGPLGAYEFSVYDQQSCALAHIIAKQTKNKKLISIAGGGDTLAVINKLNIAKEFTYLSTAGGAFLAWLEDALLPGIDALL